MLSLGRHCVSACCHWLRCDHSHLYMDRLPPATGGEAWFHYLPGKATVWWVILWLMVVTDLLYLPISWALWTALHRTGKNLMLAAVVCLNLFVVLDLAVTWTSHASLLMLFQNYAGTGDDAHRAACVAAADYASVVWTTPLLRFYVMVIPALGQLLASPCSKQALERFVPGPASSQEFSVYSRKPVSLRWLWQPRWARPSGSSSSVCDFSGPADLVLSFGLERDAIGAEQCLRQRSTHPVISTPPANSECCPA
jgi:hypothetical protein